MKPAFSTTAQASSSVTDFIRSRIASGTFGRPSGNRSPCQSAVYLITSSGVKNPCCARAPRNAPKTIEEQTIPTAACLNNRTYVSICATVSSFITRLEPRCSWNLYCLCYLFIHLHAEPGLIRRGHITLLNNLAFFDEGLPHLKMVDPMPFADQVIGNRNAHVGRSHGANRRNHTVRRKRNVVSLSHVGYLARLREPAYLLNIRHDDVSRALLQQFGVSPAQIQILPAAYRRGGGV